MQCEFCQTILKNKYILKNHQTRARYCLDIQKDAGVKMLPDIYTCIYCNREMARNMKDRHLTTCKSKILKENINLTKELTKCHKEITELKCQLQMYKELAERELDCVETIAKQPRSTTNNQTNNLMLLTPFDMNDKESFSKTIKEAFNDNYIVEGQKGVAKFAVDKLLKDKNGKLRYVCTDPSRQTYRFKSLDGTIERDIKAKKLTSAIAEDVIRQTYNISSDKIQNGDAEVFLLYSTNTQDIQEISTDNGEFRNELASLTSVN